MFALKQSARCLSYLQFSVAPKLLPSCVPTISSVLVRQPIITVSRAPVNLFSNIAAAPQNTEGNLSKTFDATDPIQAAEPDVLYHMIEIEVRAPEPAVLRSYKEFITLAAQNLNLNIEHSQPEKHLLKRWTVLKSRHVHRKHMETYEVRTYHHKIQVNRITGSTADTFLEYIQRNLPEGVAMRVGRVRMEKLPNHLTPPSTEN